MWTGGMVRRVGWHRPTSCRQLCALVCVRLPFTGTAMLLVGRAAPVGVSSRAAVEPQLADSLQTVQCC